MEPADLEYQSLKTYIAPVQATTGLSESASFLVWFLQNVYRLDETDARDAVCDHPNDKGIDGIFVDENNAEMHFLQAKIRQKATGAIGDVGPKNLMASVQQFDSTDKVAAVAGGNANDDLKRLIARVQLAELVAAGYKLVGVYISNETQNRDSEEYLKVTPALRIYGRDEIAPRIIDVSRVEGKKATFTFDTSYVDPMEMQVGSGTDKTSMYVFPARALQLVHMDGISNGSLFKENVRYSLGNTAVNKSISTTMMDKAAHGNFVLFHNGIIILCSQVDTSVEDKLTIKNYSVVNGAQSLTSFFNGRSKLSDDLRVLVRVVEVQDEELARTITENSNNQNAIKPRDLRSNHLIMMRLQQEMKVKHEGYFFEIKRGEPAPKDVSVIITNDVVGRALLAFDVGEPWSAHQIYKVFDEKYSQIFGRPEVTATRIIFVHELLAVVDEVLPKLKNLPMASYTLTRYFVLYLLGRILRENSASKLYVSNPELLSESELEEFFMKCKKILDTVAVDLNVETKTEAFDYKSILKSPKQSIELADRIITSYDKDVVREKAESFVDWTPSS